jgi:hypothetical protein
MQVILDVYFVSRMVLQKKCQMITNPTTLKKRRELKRQEGLLKKTELKEFSTYQDLLETVNTNKIKVCMLTNK